MENSIKVLFLCVGNSARSQMAEGWLRKLGGQEFEVYSAGVEPKDIHPLAVEVMAEVGIDISGQRSKSVAEYLGTSHFGYIITLCRWDEEKCPTAFPDVSVRLHWDLPDPAAAPEEERKQAFRQVRDMLERLIKDFVENIGKKG